MEFIIYYNNKMDKLDYIIHNIIKLNLDEKLKIAKLIWDDCPNNRHFIEDKSDGLLIKTEILNNILVDKIYNYTIDIL